jgi:hypothetical protein
VLIIRNRLNRDRDKDRGMDRDRSMDRDKDMDRHRDRDTYTDTDRDMDTDKDMDTDRDTDPERDMVMSPSSQLKNQHRSQFHHCFPRKTALRRHLNTVRLLYSATLYRTVALRYNSIPSVGTMKQKRISCKTTAPSRRYTVQGRTVQ